MRTDSLNVSSQAQQAARAVISGKFGPEFVPASSPVYKTRSKGAQEAHEAIRPTHPSRDPASVKSLLTPQQFKLYQLIWQRFIASQMMPAILDGTTIDIAAGQPDQLDKPPYMLRATGSVVKFPGYMKVYTAGRDDGDVDELDKGALPRVTEGEFLDLLELFPEQHFTQPPPRYSEATLIKALEEEGIGRPSTYAPTLATLLARSYITTEQKKLIPTELGAVVSDLLAEHFPNVFDIGFTSQMENELDDIASGDRAWVPTLRSFYDPFKNTLTQAEQTIQRVKLKDEPAGEDCEQCGRPMVIKMGKFGKFMACSGFPECRNSKPLLMKIGMTCPTCHEGDVVERRSKKGRTFYGCSRYPDCDFVTWNKPVETKCPRCGSHMEEVGRQGQLKCPACGHVGAALPAAG
jgi:DNA topoisomerase-1